MIPNWESEGGIIHEQGICTILLARGNIDPIADRDAQDISTILPGKGNIDPVADRDGYVGQELCSHPLESNNRRHEVSSR